MNVTNLKENYQNLLSYMSGKGYKESTISCYRRQIQWILDNAESREWTSYKDIYLEYAAYGYSYNWLRGKRALLGTLERFDLYGEYPDGKHHYPSYAKRAYDFLLPEFKKLIDYYAETEAGRSLQESSLKTRAGSASGLFYHIQEKGGYSLPDITEDMVLSFFCSGTGCTQKGHDYIHRVKTVLNVCLPLEPFHIRRILNFLPAIHGFHKNVPVLTPDEIASVKEVLRGRRAG